jgi:septal ring factor EnvC (AmiA/AmiB activator)
VLSVVEPFYFFILFLVRRFLKPKQIENNEKVVEKCEEKFETIQQQVALLQKTITSLRIQVQKLEDPRKTLNEELSVEAFLQRHSDNINRDLSDILNNIDEDLRKHRNLLQLRPY